MVEMFSRDLENDYDRRPRHPITSAANRNVEKN